MALSIGDAVVRFIADTTNLDQAFAELRAALAGVEGTADESMSAVAGSIDKVTDSAQGASTAIDTVSQSAKTAGDSVVEGMGRARGSTSEARGEAMLLGEAFGIHLPRHVSSFVAELPGVGEALSAAFAATAVLFLLDALIKGAEKIQEWREQAHKLELAWNDFNTTAANSLRALDDKLLQSGIRMDELRGDHVDALRKQLELIDHVSLRELAQEFNVLSGASDKLFTQLKAAWYEFGAGSKGAKNALDDFKAEYDLLLAEGKKKEASDLLGGTLASAKAALEKLQEAKKAAEELNQLSAETPGAEPSVSSGPSEKELQAQAVLVRALQDQVDAEQKINELAKDDTAIKRTEATARAVEESEKKRSPPPSKDLKSESRLLTRRSRRKKARACRVQSFTSLSSARKSRPSKPLHC